MLQAQLKKHKVKLLKQISIWHAHTCMRNWPQSPSTLSGWMDCWQGPRPHCPTSVPHLNNVLGAWVAANPCSRHPKPCGQHSRGKGRSSARTYGHHLRASIFFRAWSENGWKHTASFVFCRGWKEALLATHFNWAPLTSHKRAGRGGGGWGWKSDASRFCKNTRCGVKKQEMQLHLCLNRHPSTVQESKMQRWIVWSSTWIELGDLLGTIRWKAAHRCPTGTLRDVGVRWR